MNKSLSLIIVFFLFFTPLSVTAQEYSLKDLWKLALEKSETIKIAEEDLYISKREKDMALAGLLPTLSAFGDHKRYSEEKTRSGLTVQPNYTNTWGFRLDHSLSLSGQEFRAYRMSRNTIIKSGFDLDSVKGDYLLSIASAYFDVLKSKKALEIANANVDRLTKHRDASSIRLRVGAVTKTVLLRAEAELSGAQSESIKAENNLRLARYILARTAGIKEAYDIKEELPPVDLDSLSGDCKSSVLDCLRERTLERRSEIKALTLQKSIATDQVKFARGSFLPILSVEGVFVREENEPSTTFEIDERIYGTLTLNFPFFEGGLRMAEVGEAKAKLRQAEYSLSDMRKSINVEVESSYLDLLTESGVITKLQAEVEYSKDNYNAVSKQFTYGLADSIDVMDANTLLVTAERELANARYNHHLAYLKLKRATGTLLKTVVSEQ
ncbi:MAG TPA: TolC family protein [Nitrospirae bacterium]|nr:TolC family protein [Nitrospirota bacterium]